MGALIIGTGLLRFPSCHWLKGAAAVVGVVRIQALAQQLEQIIDDSADLGRREQLLNAIEHARIAVDRYIGAAGASARAAGRP